MRTYSRIMLCKSIFYGSLSFFNSATLIAFFSLLVSTGSSFSGRVMLRPPVMLIWFYWTSYWGGFLSSLASFSSFDEMKDWSAMLYCFARILRWALVAGKPCTYSSIWSRRNCEFLLKKGYARTISMGTIVSSWLCSFSFGLSLAWSIYALSISL